MVSRIGVLSFASAISLFACAAPSMAEEVGAKCQTMTMADGSKVEMCQDGRGNWVPQTGGVGVAAGDFPRRAEVSWQGTYDMIYTQPPRRRSTRGLEGLIGAVVGQGKRVTGELSVRATINGEMIVGTVGGTNLTSTKMTGTVRGGVCHLEAHTMQYDLVYKGRCDRRSFAGETLGSTTAGAKQKGTFTTATTALVDLDERDRLAAVAQAERDRQTAIAKEQRRRAAARDLPNLWSQFNKMMPMVGASSDKFGVAMNRGRDKSIICPNLRPHRDSTQRIEEVFASIRAYRQEFPEADVVSKAKFEASDGWVGANRRLLNTSIEICSGYF